MPGPGFGGILELVKKCELAEVEENSGTVVEEEDADVHAEDGAHVHGGHSQSEAEVQGKVSNQGQVILSRLGRSVK